MKKNLKKLMLINLIVVELIVFITSNFITCDAEENDTTSATEPTQNQITWPSSPSIFSQAGVLIEASTGTVLYDKNANEQLYPASITKILTTLVALENGNLDDMVDFSHYDVFTLESGDAHIGMQEGEQLSLQDCLYGVMLASANEVSNAVGEYIAKKQPEYTAKINELTASGERFDESKVAISIFSDMMNARAALAGAKNTNFCNPNGLFNENHYTSCYDMAMITRAAVSNQQFLQIESNLTYKIPATNLTSETRAIVNKHKMLFPSNAVYYDGILGGKTGYVDQSGTTLVTFAKRNGMTLIAVVMKSNAANVYNDTKLLFDYGFNNFSLANIAENEKRFTLDSTGFIDFAGSVYSSENPLLTLELNQNVVLPKDINFSQLSTKINLVDNLEETSGKIGQIEYYCADRYVGSSSVLVNPSNSDAFEFHSSNHLNNTKNNFLHSLKTSNVWLMFLLFFIFVIIFGFIHYINHQKKKKKRRKRRRKKRNRKR